MEIKKIAKTIIYKCLPLRIRSFVNKNEICVNEFAKTKLPFHFFIREN